MRTRQIEHEVFINSKSAYELLKRSLPDDVKPWWFHAGRWREKKLPDPKRVPGCRGNLWSLRLLNEWCVKYADARYPKF